MTVVFFLHGPKRKLPSSFSGLIRSEQIERSGVYSQSAVRYLISSGCGDGLLSLGLPGLAVSGQSKPNLTVVTVMGAIWLLVLL